MNYNNNNLLRSTKVRTVKSGYVYRISTYMSSETHNLLKSTAKSHNTNMNVELNNLIKDQMKKNSSFRLLVKHYSDMLPKHSKVMNFVRVPQETYDYLYNYAKEYNMALGNVIYLLLQKTYLADKRTLEI